MRGKYTRPTPSKSLNQWRKARGLTLEELARKSGCTTKALAHYLYDARSVRVRTALALARALDVRVEDIDWEKREAQVLPDFPAGPPGHVTPEQAQVMQLWLGAGRPKAAIARALGVSRPTLYAHLREVEQEGTGGK